MAQPQRIAMQYNQLGDSNLVVSEITFGTVSRKRPRQQELKEKLKMIEAEKLQNENLMSHMVIKGKMEKLEVQIESGNPNYEVIRSVGRDIKSVIDLLPESLKVAMEAEFSCQYEELKSRFHTHVNATQWVKIDNELGNLRDSDRTRFNNTHVQSDVSVAELP
ncbi:NAD(P)-linked oxidoreductase superfamily protein [Artemisia annua]|uniref:NAD(P)-linked oxidoreductase superfamily protein n=1 Tax=Artemisia annua TaxID=35608 RepID=A0A2U1QM82_ARTAN|nr:NAD(P)-linked oxidoreductase superfamily protein [Artemisia annua]